MVDAAAVLADLTDESTELDGLVAAQTDWSRPTPAAGWTIADQIGHLAWTDSVATVAAVDPARFTGEVVAAALADPDGHVDRIGAEWAARPDLLEAWRAGRIALREALAAVPPGTALPWFGPPMSATSMATARLMETWAHGQDVADALRVVRPATARLKHIAHIGVRTRDFAYAVRGEPAPDAPFAVELTGPDDAVWTWGPEDALQRISGPALDFCLLVTQRRHRDDLALVAEGADADHWLDIAQAFAGPPGNGRTKGQFA